MAEQPLPPIFEQPAPHDCGVWLGGLSPLDRGEVLHDAGYERLMRKCDEIKDLYLHASLDWRQTFYVAVLRALGGQQNRKPFIEVATRAHLGLLLRERAQLFATEAMLIGTSGLAALYDTDEYMAALGEQFDYQRHKYGITPLQPDDWHLDHIQPANHPILRVAQAAAFFARNDFAFGQMLECRERTDIRNLFRMQASAYWDTHYLPCRTSPRRPKRLGDSMVNILAISVVVPLQFAYFEQMRDDTGKRRALTLFESLAPENNYITRFWKSVGIEAANAFESQSLVQIHREYCQTANCLNCPVFRRLQVIRHAQAQQQLGRL